LILHLKPLVSRSTHLNFPHSSLSGICFPSYFT
jgi:hypothetical protein